MAAESELKINVTPQITGLDDLIGQLRRSGMALEGLADSLQVLSGQPSDSPRTVDSAAPLYGDYAIGPAVCPWILSGRTHDAHEFQIDMDVSKIGAPVDNYQCPGRPVGGASPDTFDDVRGASRLIITGTEPEARRNVKCPEAQLGQDHDAHTFVVGVGDASDPDSYMSDWRCPGHPARPWHSDNRTD